MIQYFLKSRLLLNLIMHELSVSKTLEKMLILNKIYNFFKYFKKVCTINEDINSFLNPFGGNISTEK